jgi:hypothetical protein
MEKVPGALALPVAMSLVLAWNAVESGKPLSRTCAPLMKPLPVTVSVKLPRLVADGEMPVRMGVGLRRVTALLADLVESAELVAVMEMVLGVGGAPGAA